MPLYIIRAMDGSHMSAEIDSNHAHAVFDAVKGLNSKEADVLVDDVYAFSVRLDAFGVWSIFYRDHSLNARAAVSPRCRPASA